MISRPTIFIGGMLLCLLGGAFVIHQWLENRAAPPSERLIVYGTLTNPLVRFYACRCLTPSTPIELPGFTVRDRSLHAASSTASGQLLRLTPVELARFDRYENVPTAYERTRLSIGTTTAWVYRRVDTER